MAKIVLIDKQNWTRDYLQLELQQAGHQVIILDRVENVSFEILEDRADLIVIDPAFAEADGHPDIRQIKTRHPGIQVFAWLNHSPGTDSRMISQADAFFIKNLLAVDIIKNMVTNSRPASG